MSNKLNQLPKLTNLINWHKQAKDNLTIGERAADGMRNGMGSWTFVFGFITFLAIWAFLNSDPTIKAWDPYPFILLNLFLSMLAALQGAILLIAAKRMDGISAAQAKHDLDTNIAAKAEIELLMKQNDEQLKAIEELRKLVVAQQQSKKN
jgi:uncharacterized membrane protein